MRKPKQEKGDDTTMLIDNQHLGRVEEMNAADNSRQNLIDSIKRLRQNQNSNFTSKTKRF